MAYPNANSYNIVVGALTSGLLPDTNASGGAELILAEIKNSTPGFDYDFIFTEVPSENFTVNLVGRYEDSPAHIVFVYVWIIKRMIELVI